MNEKEIKTMTKEQVDERKSALLAEIENADDARLKEIEAEKQLLDERARQIETEETRAMLKEVLAGAGKVVESDHSEDDKVEVRNTAAYVDAYANYIKTGDDRECRSLLTTNASGVLPVPAIVDEIVRTAWDNEEILSRVRKTYIKGNLKVAFERSATGAVEHTEGTSAPSEETLLLGIVTMIPKNIKKWITISDEAVTMGGEAFLRYIYDELTYQIVKKLAALVVNDIKSLSTSAGETAPAAAKITVAPGLNTVAEAFANLSDEARNCVVIMNKLTYANFKAAQAAGNFNVDPFMGLPVLFNNSLDAYDSASANAVYAIVGDLSGAQVNYPEGEGIVIKWDDLSLAEQDLVKVVGRQYSAHAVTASGRFCNIAKPSGTS